MLVRVAFLNTLSTRVQIASSGNHCCHHRLEPQSAPWTICTRDRSCAFCTDVCELCRYVVSEWHSEQPQHSCGRKPECWQLPTCEPPRDSCF